MRIFDSKFQIADSKLEIGVAMFKIRVADLDISDSVPMFATFAAAMKGSLQDLLRLVCLEIHRRTGELDDDH